MTDHNNIDAVEVTFDQHQHQHQHSQQEHHAEDNSQHQHSHHHNDEHSNSEHNSNNTGEHSHSQQHSNSHNPNRVVPNTPFILFHWKHGGNNVEFASSVNGWSPVPMTKNSDGVFVYHLENPPHDGSISYKYVVDGEWKIDPTAHHETESNGNLNNVIKIHFDPECLFCKIALGVIPAHKIIDTESAIAFLDISPLSIGHTLVVPKYHAEKLHELPHWEMSTLGPVLLKVAAAIGANDYNILQNNGQVAGQNIQHVHFHIIPRTEQDGLKFTWICEDRDPNDLIQIAAAIRSRLVQ